MNRDTLVDLVLLAALALTYAYWRRRERTVRESLTLSQRWAAADAEGTTGGTVTAADDGAIARVASLLDARPEDVPDRVAALDRKVRDLTTDLERGRERWAAAWWDARTADAVDLDDPHVTVVELPDGHLPDAQAIAKEALDDALGVTIVVAGGDGTLAVAVGADLDDQAAGDVASRVATEAGGGAGGSDDLATGGGDADRLPDAARSVAEELRADAPFA